MSIATILQLLFTAAVFGGVGYLIGQKGFKLEFSKKEILYVLAAGIGAIMGLTWFQVANNDPSTLKGKSKEEWLILLFISGVPVLYQMIVTWLAFLSVPGGKLPDLPTGGKVTPDKTEPEPPKTP